jgi:D-alanyl-D-alanine dipeptidase
MRPLALFAALVVAACAHAEPDGLAPDLVNAAEAIPGLITDIRYHGAENFVGRLIAGYEAPVCLLSRPAAEGLAGVQADLKPFGLGLKIFDCYRPTRAVADFAAWARDPDEQTRKADYYPNVDKSKLFELGYIAERSGHSRASTVDLTLVDLATGQELDMGASYDLFDTLSWPSDPRPTAEQRANRALLQSVMRARNFRFLKEE